MDFSKLLQMLGLNRNSVQPPMYPYADIEKQIMESGNQPYFGYVSDEELLAMQIASIHNLSFYLWLVKEARKQIINGTFSSWKDEMIKKVSNRL